MIRMKRQIKVAYKNEGRYARVDERLIDALRLVVAGLLLADLLLEAQPLLEGVVQLGVRVAELLATHEALKALAETGTRPVVLGQRRHHLRVTDCNGGEIQDTVTRKANDTYQ